jgi:hypothetical protein
MSWRDPAWLQRGLDALKATLDVDSALKQQMIDFLLDEGFWDKGRLKPDAARVRFNACMNPGKPEFFKLSELWALMKRFRRYELLLVICEDCGFDRPVQIPVASRRQDLLQHLDDLRVQHAEQVAAAEAQLRWLENERGVDSATASDERGLLRIHPAMRENGPRFAIDDDATGKGGF